MRLVTVTIALISIFSGLMTTSVLAAEDQSAIQKRMMERVDSIDTLKTKALIGENNKGFLEQRGPLKPNQTAILNAENADRKALYAILAERLDLTISVVGQGRAEDLRKKSAPGVWLQKSTGEWYKK